MTDLVILGGDKDLSARWKSVLRLDSACKNSWLLESKIGRSGIQVEGALRVAGALSWPDESKKDFLILILRINLL